MRRRALLAASQTGGGKGGFKADFYFDYCEDDGLSKYCRRESDDLGVACYNEAARLIDEYGVEDNIYLTILENPINYGFEVYVEGALVTHLLRDYGNIYLRVIEGEYEFVLVHETGMLTYEY